MKLHPETLDPRLSGQVRRYHTWTVIREQTDGEHSWQAARLLLAIWPDCRKEVLVQVLMHDVGERVSGDVPYPGESLEPGLKERLDKVESGAWLSMCVPWQLPAPQTLTPEEQLMVKIVDYLEAWEFGLHEESMGNRHATLIHRRVWHAIHKLAPALPTPLRENLKRYMAKRTEKQRRLGHDTGFVEEF